MPTQIDALPKTSRGREAKYELEPLFDGNAYVLIRGTKDEVKAGKADFSCEVGSMRANVYRASKNAGVKVDSRIVEHDGREGLAIQAKQNGSGKSQTKK